MGGSSTVYLWCDCVCVYACVMSYVIIIIVCNYGMKEVELPNYWWPPISSYMHKLYCCSMGLTIYHSYSIPGGPSHSSWVHGRPRVQVHTWGHCSVLCHLIWRDLLPCFNTNGSNRWPQSQGTLVQIHLRDFLPFTLKMRSPLSSLSKLVVHTVPI